jgi:fructokinase
MPPPLVAVIGEALVDLAEVPGEDALVARRGGSPLNVAIGLARLEQPTLLLARFSRDPFGTVLRNHAFRSDVDLSRAVETPLPSTTALARIDPDGVAQYVFNVDGTADFGWTDEELAGLPASVRALHFGSLASWLPPGDAAIDRRVAAVRAAGGVLVSYDPNVRPHLQPDAAHAREAVERSIRHAHLVKVSADDLAWLYPDTDTATVATGWLRCGPSLVVLTHGREGAVAHRHEHPAVARPAPQVQVADTIGAGDAFTSGLLDALLRRDLATPNALNAMDGDVLAAVLDDAALVAAVTCSRPGADPPRRPELPFP